MHGRTKQAKLFSEQGGGTNLLKQIIYSPKISMESPKRQLEKRFQKPASDEQADVRVIILRKRLPKRNDSDSYMKEVMECEKDIIPVHLFQK